MIAKAFDSNYSHSYQIASFMKNILVPVDFSVFSLNAAKAAAAIARKSGGNIHLLHLTDIPVGWSSQSVAKQQEYPVLEGRLVEAEIKLDKFSRQAFLKNCNVITYVRGGVAFEQINIFAKRNKISLIVMGVHGGGESEFKYIGSTAQKVIRTAPCPVMGVKKNYYLGGIKKILFASDFDENIAAPIDAVYDLAGDFGASIDLAYVNTPSRFVDDKTMEARMQKFMIAQKKVKFHTVIQNSSEKVSGILECAEKRKANMIAMATHLRRISPGYLLSVTESVLFHSKVPVLSFVIDRPSY
jgi:nucleotide-binding universal stress UspA family protein